MAGIQKPRRRRNGFMEGPDQVHRLNSMYRTEMFGVDRARMVTRAGHAAVDDVASPEPGEDLDDSEMSDRERREAIARERMRREGRA
jgi:hypothetical protein